MNARDLFDVASRLKLELHDDPDAYEDAMRLLGERTDGGDDEEDAGGDENADALAREA